MEHHIAGHALGWRRGNLSFGAKDGNPLFRSFNRLSSGFVMDCVATFFDKDGIAYEVVRVGEGLFHVCHQGNTIGHVYCHIFNECAVIADIRVSDCVKQGRCVLLQILGFKPRIKSYRNKGVGTALLKFALNYLKAQGCTRVEGNIMERDLKAWPRLPQWYRDHGFQVPESGFGKIWKVLV